MRLSSSVGRKRRSCPDHPRRRAGDGLEAGDSTCAADCWPGSRGGAGNPGARGQGERGQPAVRREFLKSLEEVNHVVNGDLARMQDHVLNVSFPGVDSKALMMSLRDSIAFADGAACSSGSDKREPRPDRDGLCRGSDSSSVRFSWGPGSGTIPFDRTHRCGSQAVGASRYNRTPRESLLRPVRTPENRVSRCPTSSSISRPFAESRRDGRSFLRCARPGTSPV